MSEVQSRPVAPRGGRGSGRGGRGGFAGRGGSRQQTRPAATNGDSKHDNSDSLADIEDDGEMGELKRLYGSKVRPIKDIFGDTWSDVDILFALREANGDENTAVERMASGNVSQWGEVSTKKDRTKAKAKGESFTTTTGESVPAGNTRPTRGGRGDAARGRGRATDRGGRGAIRGKPAQATNGTRAEKTELSVPTEESNAWATAKADANAGGAWGDSTTTAVTMAPSDPATTTAAPAGQKASIIPEGTQKTWASMLRQTTAPKPAPKAKENQPPKPPAEAIEPLPPAAELSAEPPAPAEEPAQDAEPAELADTPKAPQAAEVAIPVVVPEIALPPSKDLLTENNLEQVHDDSNPAPTGTTRSEATDSWDPRSANAGATPLSAAQQQHQATKAPVSGYAATAAKATERQATRTPSYTRRVLDQEEAVRMPGNRGVDSAAVQFGALNFSGVDDDIDGDREEPETRVQPPDDSPVAHPRTALPPVPQPAAVPQAFPTQQKPAASLPPVSAPTATAPVSSPWGAADAARPAAPTAPAAQQQAAGTPQTQPSAPTAPSYGRFGGQDQGFGQQSFDSFNKPNATAAQSQYDAFQSQQQSTQAPSQPSAGAFSSAPSDYSSYYTAGQPGRDPYNNYYQQGYGQQQAGQGQGQQEGAAGTQHRSVSGYNANPQNDNLGQYPQSGASRFAGATTATDAQNSGNTTPNPPGQGQQGAQGGSQQQQGLQQQQQHGSQYPFNSHPYYQNPYYSQYMNQYQGYGQGGYGGGPYGKGAGFGQQHGYGMGPNAAYDHSSSQTSGFGQSASHRGESSLQSGLGDYGSRTASSQQSGGQQGLGGASGFGGGMHDSFARGGSSYQSQAGQGFNAQSQAGANPSAADDLKPFGDSKGAGPSPSLGGARPGSATNPAASQSGLPPPQSAQQSGMGMGGYGGYPGHMQQQGQHGLHGAQSGTSGFGMGAGGNQSHGNPSYGGYGNQGYNNYYGGNQQPRGWGGNYH